MVEFFDQLAEPPAALREGLGQQGPVVVVQQIEDDEGGRLQSGREPDLERVARLVAGEQPAKVGPAGGKHDQFAVQDRAGGRAPPKGWSGQTREFGVLRRHCDRILCAAL